jgi:hypothetical protein
MALLVGQHSGLQCGELCHGQVLLGHAVCSMLTVLVLWCVVLQAGRVRPTLDHASVCVRLVCGTRQGQLEAPAWSVPLSEHRLTRCGCGGGVCVWGGRASQ